MDQIRHRIYSPCSFGNKLLGHGRCEEAPSAFEKGVHELLKIWLWHLKQFTSVSPRSASHCYGVWPAPLIHLSMKA